ncbi:MAG: acyl-CoA-binding protein [Bradymonadia bacterium]
MALKDDFDAAQSRVKTLSSRPSNADLLNLYALFKQGSAGDVSGKKPGRLDLKGRAKYEAWESKKGMSADAAMQAYVDLVNRLVG